MMILCDDVTVSMAGDREGESQIIAASNPRALSNQCRILVFLGGRRNATVPEKEQKERKERKDG